MYILHLYIILYIIMLVCMCVCSLSCTTLWSHGLQPIRLLCPWNFSRQDIGVGCHSLLWRSSWPRYGNCIFVSPEFSGRFFTTSTTCEALVCVLLYNRLFSSVQFSHSVVSDSLRPRELQHSRPSCPSPTPGVHSNSWPSSRWCHPTISSSVIPFSSCPQSLPSCVIISYYI